MARKSDPPTDATDATGALPALSDAVRAAALRPGVVVIAVRGAPECRPFAVGEKPAYVGRSRASDVALDDKSVSGTHLRLALEDGALVAEDLASTHGTRLDGEPMAGPTRVPPGAVLRLGGSLLLAVADVGPFERRGVTRERGYVVGPAHAKALDAARDGARSGRTVLIQGESGTGKEHAARECHAASGRARGPFVAHNMATVPAHLAEARLFGAKKGAYTGAQEDQIGLFQQADGGTLFLDEIGELDAAVQAKLLRVLEDGRICPLGAPKDVAVDVQVVSATMRDLAQRVAAGLFRDDLLFRLSQEVVHLPPLRERREEIPWLVELALARAWASLGRAPLPVMASLVTACVERTWPGKVRELLHAVERAARAAVRAEAEAVDAIHLSAAGTPARRDEDGPTPTTATPPVAAVGPASAPVKRPAEIRAEKVRDAWARHGGDWRKVAAETGLKRSAIFEIVKKRG